MLRLPTLLISITAALSFTGCSGSDSNAIGGPVAMRRLTPIQYTNAIEDTFGETIKVAGRFEPDSRRDGLNAMGTALVAVTPSGFEQYEAMASNIVTQVLSPQQRQSVLPCQPSEPATADDACTQQILQHFGQRLWRRTLETADIAPRIQAAHTTAAAAKDFYAGARLALISLLAAPEFLFRVETARPAPTEQQPGRLLLTDVSLASKLSYFLWNRGPDEQLLATAASGDLSDPEILAGEVDRMMSSARLRDGIRAYFDDVFLFDQFDELGKDVTRYPLYNNAMATDAREQTLRFVVSRLIEEQADYRSLFTSRELPMTRSLGPVYGMPVRSAEGWEDAVVPDSIPRAGLLTHASFNMLFAHPGRSSATLRGVFVREALLCQTIPEAPADVDFTQFSQDQQTVHRTARDRLEMHSTQASCRKCHILTDPIGLAFEVFDGIGRYRKEENGATIITEGDFDGDPFAGPVELGQSFAANPLVSACLVENLYRFAVGRKQTNGERSLLRYLENSFAEGGYQVPALMREIVLSEAFRTATATSEQQFSGDLEESTDKFGQVTDREIAATKGSEAS